MEEGAVIRADRSFRAGWAIGQGEIYLSTNYVQLPRAPHLPPSSHIYTLSLLIICV